MYGLPGYQYDPIRRRYFRGNKPQKCEENLQKEYSEIHNPQIKSLQTRLIQSLCHQSLKPSIQLKQAKDEWILSRIQKLKVTSRGFFELPIGEAQNIWLLGEYSATESLWLIRKGSELAICRMQKRPNTTCHEALHVAMPVARRVTHHYHTNHNIGLTGCFVFPLKVDEAVNRLYGFLIVNKLANWFLSYHQCVNVSDRISDDRICIEYNAKSPGHVLCVDHWNNSQSGDSQMVYCIDRMTYALKVSKTGPGTDLLEFYSFCLRRSITLTVQWLGDTKVVLQSQPTRLEILEIDIARKCYSTLAVTNTKASDANIRLDQGSPILKRLNTTGCFASIISLTSLNCVNVFKFIEMDCTIQLLHVFDFPQPIQCYTLIFEYRIVITLNDKLDFCVIEFGGSVLSNSPKMARKSYRASEKIKGEIRSFGSTILGIEYKVLDFHTLTARILYPQGFLEISF